MADDDDRRREGCFQNFGPLQPQRTEGEAVLDLPRQLPPGHGPAQRVQIGLGLKACDHPRQPLAKIGNILARAPAILGGFRTRSERLGGDGPQRIRIKVGRRQPALVPRLAEEVAGLLRQLSARQQMGPHRCHQNSSAISMKRVRRLGATLRQLRRSHASISPQSRSGRSSTIPTQPLAP